MPTAHHSTVTSYEQLVQGCKLRKKMNIRIVLQFCNVSKACQSVVKITLLHLVYNLLKSLGT